jgi:hypothetical protein
MPEQRPTSTNRSPRRARTLAMCVAALVMAIAPVACAHTGTPNPDENNPQIDARTRVRVTNQSYQDMTVYVVTEQGQNVRLGLASSTSTSTFDIPSSLVNASMNMLQFLAVPIAGNGTPRTQQLTVEPGDMVQLTITAY